MQHVVRVHRVPVGLDGIGPPAHADVDVRRHVHQVARARHRRREALGARHRALRVLRLHRVDVEVAGARVLGAQRQRRLEHARRSPASRPAAIRPPPSSATGSGPSAPRRRAPAHRHPAGSGPPARASRSAYAESRPRAVGRRHVRVARRQRLHARPLRLRRRGRESPRPARSAAQAATPAAESMGALMLGPSAKASPHAHMVQLESSRCASRNARTASSWLKA